MRLFTDCSYVPRRPSPFLFQEMYASALVPTLRAKENGRKQEESTEQTHSRLSPMKYLPTPSLPLLPNICFLNSPAAARVHPIRKLRPRRAHQRRTTRLNIGPPRWRRAGRRARCNGRWRRSRPGTTAAAASAITTTIVVVVPITATVTIGAARAGVPTVRVAAAIVHRRATIGCGARTTVAPVAVATPPTASIAVATAAAR